MAQENGGLPSHFQQNIKLTETLLIEREVEEEGQGTRVKRVGAPVLGYIKVFAGLNVRSERVSHVGVVQASRDLQSDSLIIGSPYFASLPTLITITLPTLFPISRRSRTPSDSLRKISSNFF